jgi:ubiquinone/menaquinone biosynthesis C-methylase UbiE
MQVAPACKRYAYVPDLSHTTTNPCPKSHLSSFISPRYMNFDARIIAVLSNQETSNSSLQHKIKTMAQSSTYSQGHHVVTTASHLNRTAEHEAAFLLPYIKPHHRILDIGCGPGSITTGFAKYVPSGSVTGIDLAPEVLTQAREHLASQQQSTSTPLSNVTFSLGNVLEGLSFPDQSFDIVFCNQTLIHIPSPVAALQEMKRVCRTGGIVACREGDFPFHHYPELPGLSVFHKYLWLMIHGPLPSSSLSSTELDHLASDKDLPFNAPHPPNHRSGSRIHVWAREAGFDPERIVKEASVQVMATREKREFLAGAMMGRIEKAGHREKFVKLGATEEEVDAILRDLKIWRDDVDGWYAVMNCEVICFA